MKTCPCNIIIIQDFFSEENIENFIGKKLIFLIFFSRNIHCGYTLEPPRRGGSTECPQCMFWIKNKNNRYTPANLSFPGYIKVGYKGVNITRTCFHRK